MSWQDDLLSLRSSLPEGAEPEPETATRPAAESQQCVEIVTERKGRGGKTATIVVGFTLSEPELASLAGELKKALATGGSARNGEILIQGDRRNEVREWLRSHGCKVKG